MVFSPLLQDDLAAAQLPLESLLVQDYLPFAKAAAILVLGLPILYFLARLTRSVVSDQLSPQRGLVMQKLVLYPGLLLLAVSVMNELGFSLAPLLGAAGVLGVAIGFASQTSVSNVISGFFLMGEQPFVVGDVIQVGDTTGTVLSIDTLSVKLRTFDNKFVRIPNESLVKSQFTNLTRFPIRRLDVKVGVAYKEDVERVTEVLLECANHNPLSLMEPEPVVFHDGFGDSSVDLRLAVWGVREDFVALRNQIQGDVKRRFDQEGIEIPFPHRTLYTGSETIPLPIEIASNGPRSEETTLRSSP